MTTDYKIVGPNAQTLFLGCSISEITMNLAWGSENSSCDVKLVKDYVSHELAPQYLPFNSAVEAITNAGDNNVINTQLAADAQAQQFLKPTAKFEKDKLVQHNLERSRDPLIVKDLGKKLWNPHNGNNAIPQHWYGPDPGFLGETYSVVGAPCQVKFQDISFVGFIKNWKYENALYSVNLSGPGSLLKGVKLILSEYYGTISSEVQNYAVPYGDPTTGLAFNQTLRFGNIPNLINIFGYLENNAAGSSMISDFGIRANRVFDVLLTLLGSDAPQPNKFSPYGAIMSRGAMSLSRGLLNTGSETISDPGSGGSFKLTDFGLLRTVVSSEQGGMNRCLFRLDLRQVPRPNNAIYLPLSPTMALDEFITFCCSGAGFDWNAEILPDLSGNYSGVIRINTYSRNVQNPPQVLKNFIRNFGAQDCVVSYDVGEEFKEDNVRKVIMGGKQERLYQVTSHTLSRYKNAKIYDPVNHRWMNVSNNLDTSFLNAGNANNSMRIPFGNSQRIYADWRQEGSAAVAQTTESVDETESWGSVGSSVTRGNYKTSRPKLANINDSLGNSLGSGISGGAAYPIHLDLISPYFGRSFDGNARKVFYDRKRRQLLINCPLSDISKSVPVLAINSGFLTISENEIRAAKASFDSWLAYLFEPTKFQVWKPMARLVFSVLQDILGEPVANTLRLVGPGVIKNQGKDRNPYGTYHTGNPISPSQSILYSNTVMPILQALHSYVSQDLGQHYGKDYLVRVPDVTRTVGDDGIAKYDWEITDSGWEEEGNFIDDTMVVGDNNANLLTTENGKFGPIIGWNNSLERDYSWPPIGNLAVFGAAMRSNMRGILKGMASMSGKTDNSNFTYFPLNTSADGITIFNSSSNQDSFGSAVNGIHKFYQKASIMDVAPENQVNKKILYDTIASTYYCVISAPSEVTIHSRDSLVKTIYEDTAVELLEGDERASYYSTIDLQYMFQRFLTNVTGGTASYLLMMIAVIDGAFYSNPGSSVTTTLNNEGNMPIVPRAAVPCFAAIPVRYNRYLYGPWSTAPGLVENLIFPNTNSPSTWSNNVVGGVDVEVNPQYVPWNYDGMSNLDEAMLKLLNEGNEYQQIEETGRITLAGIILNDIQIGRRLQQAGPVCNSLVLTIGNDGIKTTYSFRTFSRRLGYFNKENAQTIQKFAQQSRALKTQIVENINNVRTASRNAGRGSSSNYVFPKSMSFSPVSILVGAAYPFLHKDSPVNNFEEQCNFNPKWPERPLIPNSIPSTTTGPKHISAVSLYDPAEMDRALFKEEESFSQKSVMSLDGIFSPVSLYPTAYHATFALSKYRRSQCPMCQGSNTYNYLGFDEEVLSSASDVESMIQAQGPRPPLTPCPYCLPDNDISKLTKKGAQPAEITPPFLIGSGTDREIVSDREELYKFSTPIVNNYNYNPIVLATSGAEFSCSSSKQRNDFCGHSIDVVGFGNVVPRGDDSLRAAVSDNPTKNHNFLELNADDPSFTQNQRFFGLRGPIILHSWGYDLEGYPVPNSSGEYKLAGNTPMTDQDGNPVGKNQVLQSNGEWSAPYKESTFMKGWAQQPASWPVGPIDFRWDSVGRVWTIGSNYKPVWVVIENDLVNENPVRGIVVESSYSNDPLPSGLRKMVFVKDTMGMFSSPRGAALYCRYDSVNGFYEPIYNRPLVTSGTIEGGRTATIYTAYTPSMVSDDIVSEYTTVFENPLNLPANTNTVGLFIFLNGKWTLQAARN